MKPGRAIAINNDKNNPIRRLFDLSAPIFRARSIRLITILLDLGGEPSRADSAEASRATTTRARSNLSNHPLVELYIFAIVISITSHFSSPRRSFFVADRRPIWTIFLYREKISFPLAGNLSRPLWLRFETLF